MNFGAIMNIGIITVFKTDNCGSFLQAFALQHVLNQNGYKTFFVPYIGGKDNLFRIFLQVVSSCIKFRFKNAAYLILRTYNFRRLRSKYFVIGKNAEVYILGSDTIWNFSDSFFLKNNSLFIGNWTDKPKITYAASAGFSSIEDFYKINSITDKFCALNFISVRDIFTLEIVKKIVPDKKMELVLDPTMLMAAEDYIKLEKVCYDNNFVLFYYFGKIPDSLYKQAREFAENPALAEKCGENAREVVNRFEPNKIIDMWENYIRSICK